MSLFTHIGNRLILCDFTKSNETNFYASTRRVNVKRVLRRFTLRSKMEDVKSCSYIIKLQRLNGIHLFIKSQLNMQIHNLFIDYAG